MLDMEPCLVLAASGLAKERSRELCRRFVALWGGVVKTWSKGESTSSVVSEEFGRWMT
jgi:hypothetical protein